METSVIPAYEGDPNFKKFMDALLASSEELDKRRKSDMEAADRQRKVDMEAADRQRKADMEEFDKQLKAKIKAEGEEFDRKLKADREEFDRKLKEDKRKDEARARRLDKQLGLLGNRFGSIAADMIIPNLVKQFRKIGFVFTKAYPTPFYAEGDNEILAEVDAFMENGDKVMIVEIKSKPLIEDIKYHIERMNKLRIYADKKGDKRVYLGAIGGLRFSEGARKYALKRGFYVVEASGNTFRAIAPDGENAPREWV